MASKTVKDKYRKAIAEKLEKQAEPRAKYPSAKTIVGRSVRLSALKKARSK